MLQSVTLTVSRQSAKWDEMKRGIARNGVATQLASLKARVDEAWGKGVWTQPQLRHLLSVLSELPLPLVRRSNIMKQGYGPYLTPSE